VESEEQKPTEEMQTKDPDVIKEEKDDIRKIIKFESTEETPTEEEESTQKSQEPPKKDSDDRPDIDISGEIEKVAAEEGATTTTRESLEHKRELFQHIKDFEFQIKKNQEVVGVTKDLDDLVSLYEIVSEQMNPFVGLSKVTKTRLDALENFITEVDLLKERTGELESFAEQSGAKLKGLGEQEVHAKTIDTDTILGIVNTVDTNTLRKLSDGDLDKIIEKSLGVLSLDDRIDMDIDEFIESLKG